MTDEQLAIKNEIENLLRRARRANLVLCGFLFRLQEPDQMLVNFTNTNEAIDAKVYELLLRICDRQREKGNVRKTTVTEVN